MTTWEDLYDVRKEPSNYVEESSRSMAERALDHWKEFLEGFSHVKELDKS